MTLFSSLDHWSPFPHEGDHNQSTFQRAAPQLPWLHCPTYWPKNPTQCPKSPSHCPQCPTLYFTQCPQCPTEHNRESGKCPAVTGLPCPIECPPCPIGQWLDGQCRRGAASPHVGQSHISKFIVPVLVHVQNALPHASQQLFLTGNLGVQCLQAIECGTLLSSVLFKTHCKYM